MAKSIDAVTDHSQRPASAMAMRLGKHCFKESRWTHTLFEARKLAEIAREMKVTTQMGNQGTAGKWPADQCGPDPRGRRRDREGGPRLDQPPHLAPGRRQPCPWSTGPATLNWDLWLGPMVPYGFGYHPCAGRGYWDFGTGALGDMACHTLNMPFAGPQRRSDPIAVEAESPGHNKIMYPKWSIIKYTFPARRAGGCRRSPGTTAAKSPRRS